MANYRVLDDNDNEITQLYIPKECVLGSALAGNKLAGVNSGAFKDCSRLTSVEFEDACQIGTIGDYEELGGAFENCSSITTIILNANDSQEVKNFGIDGAFKNCSSLSNVNTTNLHLSDVNSGIQLGQDAFNGTAFVNFNVPYVNTLGNSSLANCSLLQRVTTDAYFVGSEVFKNDSNLTTVTFRNADLYHIGSKIFKGCSSLTTIIFYGTVAQWQAIQKQNGWEEELADIPSEWADETYLVNCYDGDTPLVPLPSAGMYDENTGTYTSWEDMVSQGIITLDSNNKITAVNTQAISGKLVFDDSVSDIATNGFYGCSNLTEIVFREPINLTSANVFGATGITEVNTKNILNLPSVTFTNCTSLTKVVLSANTNISNASGAFSGCTALTDLTLEEGIETIPSGAGGIFDSCSSLVDVVFPDSLKGIYCVVFSHCTSIKNITLGLKYGALSSTALFSFYSDSTTAIFYDCPAIEHLYFNGNIGDWFSYANMSNYRRKEIVIAKQIYDSQQGYYIGCLPIEAKDGDIRQHYIGANNSIIYKASSRALNRANMLSDMGYSIINDKLWNNGVEVKNVHIPGGFNYDTSHYYYYGYASGAVFGNLTNIETLELPACLTSLSYSSQKGTISDCPNLKKVNFRDLQFVSSYTYTVNNGFEEMDLERYNYMNDTYSTLLVNTNDFTNSLGNLKYLRLGNQVIPYQANAISGLNSLEKLVIGKIHSASTTNTANFGNNLSANSLRVEYEGTIADYNNTSYMPSNFKTALTNLQVAAGNTIHCTDGDCDFAGNAI